jgi:hypothetical protein
MEVLWTGDLDDDCTAVWGRLFLHAEWMDGNRWWWAVTDLDTGEEIDSSNEEGWCNHVFASGEEARQAAEWAAEGYLSR